MGVLWKRRNPRRSVAQGQPPSAGRRTRLSTHHRHLAICSRPDSTPKRAAVYPLAMSLRSRTGPRPPGFIEPALPSASGLPPSGSNWIHEIKFDGFRMLARRDGPAVRLFTRNGYDWTERFPLIRAGMAALRVCSCLIDGEVVCCEIDGVPSFELLRYRHHDGAVFLYAFDLLEVNGQDMRSAPLEERRAALAKDPAHTKKLSFSTNQRLHRVSVRSRISAEWAMFAEAPEFEGRREPSGGPCHQSPR
jgi:ATP-dependent DNA ligase